MPKRPITLARKPETLRVEITDDLPRPLPKPITVSPEVRDRLMSSTAPVPLSGNVISRIVVGGLNPDSVLAQVRTEGGVSFAIGRVGRPIDHLRHNVPFAARITDEQHAAAERYLGMVSSLGRVGSNTAGIIANSVFDVPADDWQIEGRAYGRLMAAHDAERPVHQDDVERVAQVWRLKRVRERLPREYLTILDDLVVRELGVGAISRRWGVSPDAMGLSVRFALANLERVLMEVDAEFRACAIEMMEAGR